MPKALTISGMVVAALLLLLFGLDMAFGFPFNKANPARWKVDVVFVISAGILAYLSWSTFKELR